MTNLWSSRPADYRRLLNPAFCGRLVSRAVKGFEELAVEGMPLPLSFLVLPMVLPTTIREALPVLSTTSFPKWIHENPEVRVGFSRKVRSLSQVTREGLLFYLERRTLFIGSDQRVSSVPRRLSATGLADLEKKSHLVTDMVNKARFVGRWFARSGEPSTIFFLLGLRP